MRKIDFQRRPVRWTGLAACRTVLLTADIQPRRANILTHCTNWGVRIVPTPKEMREWRKAADLSQREMGQRPKISAAYVAYLESGKRSPSATVIGRYWKFIPD